MSVITSSGLPSTPPVTPPIMSVITSSGLPPTPPVTPPIISVTTPRGLSPLVTPPIILLTIPVAVVPLVISVSRMPVADSVAPWMSPPTKSETTSRAPFTVSREVSKVNVPKSAISETGCSV
ncbi:hypothetical protein D9M73_183220 [compost metagenome]